MADNTDAPQNPTHKPLHPACTVTNIQNKVRILDGVKVSYLSWVKLFQLHAKGYKVLAHIDGTPPPAKDHPGYADWSEIDAIVLQWIYSTLSDELLVRVLETESTSVQAWTRLEQIFLNNKWARAAALEHEFTNLTLKSMPSLQAYCQKLKELGDQLKAVDSPMNDQRLVLKLVSGLPPEYDTTAAIINQSLPTWEEAVGMLDSDYRRQLARDQLSSSSAMAAISQPTGGTNSGNRRRNGSRPNNQHPNRRQPSQTNFNNTNNSNPRPKNSGLPHNHQWVPYNFPNQPMPQWSSLYPWMPPPCPYPTQPGWAPWAGPPQHNPGPQYHNHTTCQQQHNTGPSRKHSSSGPSANLADFDPLIPTQLGEAFQTLNMNADDDGEWNMDTGASDHLTGDQGTEEWTDSLPPQ
ncbi:hypothetical protein HanPI659440_Chr01g0011321 [Helianthus annuus]|nr:hypothetical protein HanPI659440_Chr01g0011321 [Helianthus annuus]